MTRGEIWSLFTVVFKRLLLRRLTGWILKFDNKRFFILIIYIMNLTTWYNKSKRRYLISIFLLYIVIKIIWKFESFENGWKKVVSKMENDLKMIFLFDIQYHHYPFPSIFETFKLSNHSFFLKLYIYKRKGKWTLNMAVYFKRIDSQIHVDWTHFT